MRNSPSARCHKCGAHFVRVFRHCPKCYDEHGQPKPAPAPALPCFAIGQRVTIPEFFVTGGGKLTGLTGTVTRIDTRFGSNYVHIEGLGEYLISSVRLQVAQ